MAKFYGEIGFAEMVEKTPGVWKEQIIRRNYYGDLVRNARRLQSTDKANDDIVISNEVSILADPYAVNNFHSIRYVEFMGNKWTVTNAEVSYPRLILTLGGVRNDQQIISANNT